MSLETKAAPAALPQILLADIGGTYSRFALADATGRPGQISVISNDDIAALDAAILNYLADTKARPHTAVLAVAGPVNGEEIALTNRAWHFRLGDLADRIGVARIKAVNDFEAIAWALARLDADDVRRLGGDADAALARPESAKVVLGPGTGLGVAALVPVAEGWQAVPSEGGHCSFGADSSDEEPIFARLRAQDPGSAETVLSGPGIARLHAALHPGAALLRPRTIVGQALAGDASAQATIRLFTRLLGRFAGDIALTFKATGGVYLGGGVVRRLGSLLDAGIFRAAFEGHPPHQALLEGIPTYVMTFEQPGLLGCAALAAQMARPASMIGA
jgi:glucokinase